MKINSYIQKPNSEYRIIENKSDLYERYIEITDNSKTEEILNIIRNTNGEYYGFIGLELNNKLILDDELSFYLPTNWVIFIDWVEDYFKFGFSEAQTNLKLILENLDDTNIKIIFIETSYILNRKEFLISILDAGQYFFQIHCSIDNKYENYLLKINKLKEYIQ
ncbi:hypothetical protein [Niallia sp. RD1]|uniref:hypothetical protein n=1 Tax=Niallia sp. RD1 TaxID=2962858 RepID=UPI0020C19721|nr:hypothetical protein [Niallia sp. RD1]UTI42014.1 hypothetical protein NKG37_24890 [Niallia sp. RD1]